MYKYAYKNFENWPISTSFKNFGNKVTLTVSDNGCGLDKCGKSKESSGFGMMIASMLAEQLDGAFNIRNNKDTKCVLEFSLIEAHKKKKTKN